MFLPDPDTSDAEVSIGSWSRPEITEILPLQLNDVPLKEMVTMVWDIEKCSEKKAVFK